MITYQIKVKTTGRYIIHCDKCWYETSIVGKRYTHDEAVALFDQLKKHYIYEVTLEGSDGSIEELSAFSHILGHKPTKNGLVKTIYKQEEKQDDTEPVKKSIFKLNARILKKSC